MVRESLYPKDWIKKAGEDLKRVERRINEGDLTDAAFHLQQAIEKYLKGYLLSRGWKLIRVHDLEFLLDEALKHNPDLENFREVCQEATGYYLADRYPLLEETPKERIWKQHYTRLKN